MDERDGELGVDLRLASIIKLGVCYSGLRLGGGGEKVEAGFSQESGRSEGYRASGDSIEWPKASGRRGPSRGPARTPQRHLPENDSSLNGEVSIGDSLGTRIWMKPTPLAW